MRCDPIGSCQSAATSEIVKALLVTSLTHVSGAITSVQTFTFLPSKEIRRATPNALTRSITRGAG